MLALPATGWGAEASRELIIPDGSKNLRQGGLAPLGALKTGWTRTVVEAMLDAGGYSARTPLDDVDEATLSGILYGADQPVVVPGKAGTKERQVRFDGVIAPSSAPPRMPRAPPQAVGPEVPAQASLSSCRLQTLSPRPTSSRLPAPPCPTWLGWT